MTFTGEKPIRTISFECHCAAHIPAFVTKICRIVTYALFSHQGCLKAVTKVNPCKHSKHCTVLRILKYMQKKLFCNLLMVLLTPLQSPHSPLLCIIRSKFPVLILSLTTQFITRHSTPSPALPPILFLQTNKLRHCFSSSSNTYLLSHLLTAISSKICNVYPPSKTQRPHSVSKRTFFISMHNLRLNVTLIWKPTYFQPHIITSSPSTTILKCNSHDFIQ